MSSGPTHNADRTLPRHIAVVMDGNGRWARKRAMPRHFGHRSGVKSVRTIVRHCGEIGVEYLTLFAFSSENWTRPQEEVLGLMKLFLDALQREVAELHENNVRLTFVGDLSRLSDRLRAGMQDAERVTTDNTGLSLQIAVGYGGRWDIVEAAKRLAEDVAAGRCDPASISEADFAERTSLGDCPEPDLMIRTGGEQRISNFLLWHLAYAELHFSDVLWPDFDVAALEVALDVFRARNRRFGGVRAMPQEEVG
ncbi:MAG: polyprenyl diphosphate synthase [Pseudomonadota bacterium]